MSNSNGSTTETSASQSTIYVGNLDPRVTDTLLHDIFAALGPIKNVKIITARRHGPYAGNNLSYGFVEFEEREAAETALKTMNGRKLFNYEIRLNWAQPTGQNKEDTANHFHVFVGDLAPEITSQDLSKAFSVFGTLSDAHVMWDSVSGKSRGFGFVAFKDKTDAEQAIATMNGECLGSRAIRCNWATQKGQTATPPPQPGQQLPYEVVLLQTPSHVTSVYVGNLAPETTENDLSVPFSQFGQITEIRIQSDRGYAFVKMDAHEHAATAIVKLQNVEIHGRPAKLSWGKDRSATGGGGQQHQYWNTQNNPNWHQNGGGGNHDQHLYSGRGARYHHHHRGGGHSSSNAHILTGGGNNQTAQTLDTTTAAPSSLASLDPHSSGTTQAFASTTATTQWNKQVVEPQMYNAGTSNI